MSLCVVRDEAASLVSCGPSPRKHPFSSFPVTPLRWLLFCRNESEKTVSASFSCRPGSGLGSAGTLEPSGLPRAEQQLCARAQAQVLSNPSSRPNGGKTTEPALALS